MNRHEQQIVRILADSVRVMTVRQIARTWWSDTRWGQQRATEAMTRLAADGWLHIQNALARPIQSFVAPLVAWRPGARRPDFGATARLLHQRAMVAARPMKVVFAATRAVRFFSSGPALPVKLTQMTHDLNVSELYLHYRKRGLPDPRWKSEARLGRDWPIKERPDAVLRDDAGTMVCAVEYGGDYTATRLAELHAGLSSIHLPYEVW